MAFGHSFLCAIKLEDFDGGLVVGLMQVGVAADGVGKHMVVERGPRLAVQQRDDDEDFDHIRS